MYLEHASPFTLEYLLEEILLDIWCVSVSLMRLSEISLLIQYLYQPLREIAIASFPSVVAGAQLSAALLGLSS